MNSKYNTEDMTTVYFVQVSSNRINGEETRLITDNYKDALDTSEYYTTGLQYAYVEKTVLSSTQLFLLKKMTTVRYEFNDKQGKVHNFK